MHIKTIVIDGFKSYGTHTAIDTLDPGCNVIVGRNGSGKSNFFTAIQFVLSDEYTRLQQAQRQALLNDKRPRNEQTASVEIIFDNTDRRIAIDKNEISVKRIIGIKGDQYILNKTNSSRADILSLLETAGFSKSNPYYIVRQGKVNEVAMTSESRFTLLKEIAGVQVYEERRKESLAILEETRVKIRNINGLLETINDKLETLKTETDELKQYQYWDKKLRTVEYTIYEHELSNNKNKLSDFQAKHGESKKEQANQQKIVEGYLKQLEEKNRKLKKVIRDIKMTEEEKDNLSKELQKLTEERVSCSMKISDLKQDIEISSVNLVSINRELERLNAEIQEVQTELNRVKPKYEEAVREGEEILRTLNSLEQEQQILFARQGRNAQFGTREERDDWINKELTSIEKQIEEKRKNIEDLDTRIDEKQLKLNELEQFQVNCSRQMAAEGSSIDKFREECFQFKKNRDELLAQKKELLKQQKVLENELSYLSEDLSKINQNLISRFGKGIFNGINSVNKVLKTFNDRPDMRNQLHLYHGLVIDRFACEESVFKAVEVTAGQRLFHHIVETAEFGQQILEEMNRQKLPGVVTFMPINRLLVQNESYPDYDNAIPLITKLSYDQTYRIPVRHVFGKVFLCREMKDAAEVAKKGKFDCVTLGGDQASSKGWLKGGYFSDAKSPMKMQKEKLDLILKMDSVRIELSKLNKDIKDIDDKINKNVSQLQFAETKWGKARETHEKLTYDLNNIKEEIETVRNDEAVQGKKLQELKADLSSLETLKKNLEEELEQDLIHETKDDHEKIQKLNDTMAKWKKELKEVFEKRDKLKIDMRKCENLLKGSLKGKKNDLERNLQEICLNDKKMTLQELEDNFERISTEIKNCENDMAQIKSKREECSEEEKKLLKELDKLHQKINPAQQDLEKNSKELEYLSNNIRILQNSIDDTKNKIADLGIISSNNKYKAMRTKELYKELDDCRKNLKNYEHVNKKALDQYDNFKGLKENLFKRKEELDRAEGKIQELFEFLRQRRCESVLFTFKQVSKYFSEIFSKLVPGGKADLVMEHRDSQNGSSRNSSSSSTDVDDFVGIGIRVSFTGQRNAMTDYNQLSGGQKSLVALTLIFAIQKCDPAPFYLFDEIDRDLDAEHRRAVARMIRELSAEAQFIIITFRPELLEHANKIYGVSFQNHLSTIQVAEREAAITFLGDNEDGE